MSADGTTITLSVESCTPVPRLDADNQRHLGLRLKLITPQPNYNRLDFLIEDEGTALELLAQWVAYCQGKRGPMELGYSVGYLMRLP